jgi:purine-cytosine permease-like protein
VSRLHELVGFVVVGVFAIGWIWGGLAYVRRREPGERFWVWLAVAQVVVGVQTLVGIALLAIGRRPTDWLHYVYGFGPILILVIAHRVARGSRDLAPGRGVAPWAAFSFASFVCFGLTLRALMTGLGLG